MSTLNVLANSPWYEQRKWRITISCIFSVTHLGGMIRYMQQVKELLLKNRLQISTYLTRVEHTGFTLYAKSPNLVISIPQVTPVINTIHRTHTHTLGLCGNAGRSLSSTTQLSLTVDTAIRIVWHSAEVAHFTHKIRGTSVSSTTRGTSSTRRSEERRVGKECRSRWSPYH